MGLRGCSQTAATTRDIRETEAQKTKTSSQTRTPMPGVLSPRFRSWPESLACLRMHARRAGATFTCWEMATGLFALRIRDDRTPGNGLIRRLVPVVPAQYYKWAKWTSIRDAFLFEWKSEQSLCTVPVFPFSIFDDISWRCELCTDEMRFLFFRETILKLQMSIFIH